MNPSGVLFNQNLQGNHSLLVCLQGQILPYKTKASDISKGEEQLGKNISDSFDRLALNGVKLIVRERGVIGNRLPGS